MRVSLNTNAYDIQFGSLFLEDGEAEGVAAFSYKGTLRDGLEITFEDTHKRGQNYSIFSNETSRVVRVPIQHLGFQPKGRSKRPVAVVDLVPKDEGAVVLAPLHFSQEQMAEGTRYTKNRKGLAKPSDRIRKVQAFQCTDGSTHATQELAVQHQWELEHEARTRQFLGKQVEDIREDRDAHRTSIIFTDESKLLISGIIMED